MTDWQQEILDSARAFASSGNVTMCNYCLDKIAGVVALGTLLDLRRRACWSCLHPERIRYLGPVQGELF